LFKLKLAEAKPLDAFVIKGKLEHSSQPPTPEISSRKSTPNRSPSSVTGIDKSPSSSSPSPSRGRLSCEDRFQKAYFQQANVKTPLKNLLASESPLKAVRDKATWFAGVVNNPDIRLLYNAAWVSVLLSNFDS